MGTVGCARMRWPLLLCSSLVLACASSGAGSHEPAHSSAPPATTQSSSFSFTPPASSSTAMQEDPYLWLEDVTGEKALAWAKQRNEHALQFLRSPEQQALEERLLRIYNSQ